MAITFAHRLAGSTSSNSQSSYTTASITPATDGSPMFCWMLCAANTGGTPSGLTSMTGLGLTWTVRTAGTTKDAGGTALKVALAYGVGIASAGTCVLTLTSSTNTAGCWSFVQAAGAHTTVPIITTDIIQSTSTSAATSMSLTLPGTPVVGNAILAGVSHAFAEDITAGTNFTKGTNVTVSAPDCGLNWQGKTILDTTVDATWTSSVGYNAIGVEVQADSGASPVGFIPI